ncbi:CD276 antigen homolog [Chaetodon auriga]|uniref:CD276 antigen homolog n=1 Tax=Chaetodon auriga TaxID=39042 RepID=UPI004032B54C
MQKEILEEVEQERLEEMEEWTPECTTTMNVLQERLFEPGYQSNQVGAEVLPSLPLADAEESKVFVARLSEAEVFMSRVSDAEVMSRARTAAAAMKLLPVVSLCLLTCSETTSADGNVVVEEGRDVILPCSLSTNVQSELFDWKKDGQKEVFLYDAGVHYNNGRSGQDEQFKGRVSHFQDELKLGNASIIIRNTKVADSGSYTCDFPRLQPRQTFHIQLVVDPVLKDRREENIAGAAPKPSVTTLYETKDWALLQCLVRGASPKPKVEWKDSDGNMVPAHEPQVSQRGGGAYDVTLQATVTKTDRFRCVVTQEEIHHQIYAETFVHINGATSEPCVTILNETNDGILLQCLVQGAFPKPKVEFQDSSGNMVHAHEPQVSQRGDGAYDVTLQAAVTKTDRFRCVVTQEEIHHQTEAKIYVPLPPPSNNGFPTGWVVGAVLITFVVTVVVVGGLALSCVRRSRR